MTRIQLRDIVAAILLSTTGSEYRRVSLPVQMMGETFFLVFPGESMDICLEDLIALSDALMIEPEMIHFSPVVVFPPDAEARAHYPIRAHMGPFELWSSFDTPDAAGTHLGERLYARLRENLVQSDVTLNEDGVPYKGPMAYGEPYPTQPQFFFGPMLLLRITEVLIDDEDER